MNKTNLQVSVIIPSYNRQDTISQTIESILYQRCNFDFEIVIGDDCSTDHVRNILLEYKQKYPDIIKLLFHENNIGLGANWASCVKLCQGKYIANCDNDDYWHNPNKLQLQVDFMESHSDYGVIHTDYRTHNRVTGKIEECEAYIDDSQLSLQKAFFHGKYKICNATMMYRRDVLLKYIPLDDYINYKFTLQDWNTWLILAAYTKFYHLSVSTATFGVETESITRANDIEKLEKRMSAEKQMYKYLCNIFPNNLPFDEKGYDSYTNHVLLNLAYKKLDYQSAKKLAILLKNENYLSPKILYANNPVKFYVFGLLKRLKSKK